MHSGKPKHTWLLVAVFVVVLLLGGIAVNASTVYEFIYGIFTFGYVDHGLEQLTSSDVNTYSNINSESNDINLEVTNAVSDTYMTIIQLRATGKSLFGNGILDILPTDIKLYDENGKKYELDNIGSGSYIEGKTYEADVCPAVFEGGPDKKCKMTLYVSMINGIVGNWTLNFDVTPNTNSKHFDNKTKYEFKNGTVMTITDVDFYQTRTVVEGRYDNYIDKNKTSVVYNALLYVNNKKYELIRYGSDHEKFYFTFPPVDNKSNMYLEIQLGYLISDDGLNDEPDKDNILRNQIVCTSN